MKLIVERICDDFVILEKEDLSQIRIDLSLLPSDLREGNVLVFDGKEYRFDAEAEAEIRERITQKQRNIFKRR